MDKQEFVELHGEDAHTALVGPLLDDDFCEVAQCDEKLWARHTNAHSIMNKAIVNMLLSRGCKKAGLNNVQDELRAEIIHLLTEDVHARRFNK